MITTPVTADLIAGALEIEQTERGLLPHRLPAWARAQAPDAQVGMVEAEPSGVRLRFRTAATVIELEALRTQRVYAGVPPRPDGRYDLVVGEVGGAVGTVVGSATVGAGRVLTMDMSTGAATLDEGPAGRARFSDLAAGPKDVELWLPHNETAELIALHTDAAIEARPAPGPGRPTWLHHGSSISQGSNATTPTGIWPVVAARSAGAELVNLGFGGSGMLDPFAARTMRDLPADVISVKLGINVVNADAMRLRAFGPAVHGFLDTIREGHPTTPLLVVSPILCPIHEETPGPGTFDLEALARGELRYRATGDPAEVRAGKLTLQVVREQLAAIVARRAASDPHLTYLDGRELYGEPDAAGHPLPDALHPGPETHRLIGERFATAAFGPGGAFAPAGA